MAVYFLRTNGADSNNGTSPATAWRTWGKVFGTTGIASGDTIYIGAGVYRETLSITMTSAVAETSIIGDIDGTKTGDAGKIILTPYTINDETLPSTSFLLDLNGRDFLTFKNILFICGNTTGNQIINAQTNTSTDIKFLDCVFFGNGGNNGSILFSSAYNIKSNWIIDGCIFSFAGGGSNRQHINIVLTTGVGQDYNSNFKITNCLFLGGSIGCILITSSGSSAGEGGGVIVNNCTFMYNGSYVITTQTTRVGGSSFLYPIEMTNCFIYNCGNGFNAGELGAIIENYNLIYITSVARNNVAIGRQSVSDFSVCPLIEVGESLKWFKSFRPFATPSEKSPLLGHGDKMTSNNNLDIVKAPRPAGINTLLYKGAATSAGATTLTDTSKSFGSSNTLNGYTLKILDGAGKGQTKTINGNTNTVISGDGLWINQPDSTSTYAVFQGQTTSTGPVSGATASVLGSSGAIWGDNFWLGHTCFITSGTASGSSFIVSGNGANILTGWYPMAVTPAVNDSYLLAWGASLKGKIGSATNTTLTDDSANWPNNFWTTDWRCMILNGTGAGSNFGISGNSTGTLSGWNVWSSGTPAAGDQYIIFQNTGNLSGYYPSGLYPNYGQDYIQGSVGCYERFNTAIKETGIVLSGGNSIQLFGPGIQDFQVPVSGATTINVFGYYDTNYSGTPPQLIIKDGSGISVLDATGVMIGPSGAWEKISVSFTPSGPGVLTARLQSNSTGSVGSCYFDAFSIV